MNRFFVVRVFAFLSKKMAKKMAKIMVMTVAITLSSHTLAHSMDPNHPWAVDLVMSYQDAVQPVALGFLPTSSHADSAGVSLRHIDIARSFFLDEHDVYSRVTIAAHGNEVAVDEAFATKTLSKTWSLTVGQVMPEMGLYHNQHQHRWMMNDLPLVYNALWGGQNSEGAVLATWSAGNSTHWMLTQKIGVYSTQAFDTQGNSAAVMWNNRLSYRSVAFSLSVLSDVYAANLTDRGLNLFSTDPTQHSHSSTYTDYFSGSLWHGNVGFSLSWHRSVGELSFNSEYQIRNDAGDLRSAPGETLDATAKFDAESWGAFTELSWVAHSGLLLAVRQQMLGSDVVLNNLASNDLETSVLNNTAGSVSGISWLAGYAFADAGNTKLKVQFNDNDSWAKVGPEWTAILQQGYRF